MTRKLRVPDDMGMKVLLQGDDRRAGVSRPPRAVQARLLRCRSIYSRSTALMRVW